MTLADEINRMIETMLESLEITSANPVHINRVIQVNQKDNPDLESLIREGSSPEEIGRKNKIEQAIKDTVEFKKGNIGEIQRLTSQQFSNIRQLALNPFQFVLRSVFTKFGRGVGIAAFAVLFFEIVKFIIDEMLKPGRFLDVRFKRDIANEIIAFRSREEKQALLQGTQSIIITTIGGLRGGQGQISSNLRALGGMQSMPLPKQVITPGQVVSASGLDMKLAKGKGRRFG